MIKKGDQLFIEKLISTFPELKDEVLDEDWAGLISLQVGCFTRFTQRAINTNNIILLKKCFQFVDDNINDVDFYTENSITLSWLGKLNFDNNRNLYQMLSPKLQETFTRLQDYDSESLKSHKLKNFLNNPGKNKG